MALQEYFSPAIEAGMQADPRGRAAIERDLQDIRKTFDEHKPGDREACGTGRLTDSGPAGSSWT